MSYVLLPTLFQDDSRVNSAKLWKAPERVVDSLPSNVIDKYYAVDSKTLKYPREITLAGRGLYQRVFHHPDVPKDDQGTHIYWDADWQRCTQIFFEMQSPAEDLPDGCQIYFDMDPLSTHRVWITQPIHIYACTYVTQDESKNVDWTILMLEMRDVYTWSEGKKELGDDAYADQPTDAWSRRYAFFEKPQSDKSYRFFEFLYLKQKPQSKADLNVNVNDNWGSASPGPTNAAVLYDDVMSHFHKIIGERLSLK